MDDWKLIPARDLCLPAFERHQSLCRETGLPESILRILWTGFVRGLLRCLHQFRALGRENLPAEPPFVIVANHASHADAPAIAAALPIAWRDIIFPIAAHDVFFGTPRMASFAAIAINALSIERAKSRTHAMRQLRARLIDEKCIYILFPEGTRTRTGAMQHFRAGVGSLVAGSSVPVVPCYLAGTFQALPPNRVIPRPHPISLHIARPMAFGDVADNHAGWVQIAARLEAAVRQIEQFLAPMADAIPAATCA